MLKQVLVYLVDSPFKKIIWKRWYNFLTSSLINKNFTFMNYGYADLSTNTKSLGLSSEEQQEIYCAQLYHHVANAISLNSCDVLEVGCGRGGGSSYIRRYLQPKSMTGVDLSERNIAFCQQNHGIPGLSFSVGDAESLPFTDSSFDVVVNVESSHCYASIDNFFAEVFRTLHPQGHFLYADFREKDVIDDLKSSLTLAGFKIMKFELITENVVKAMDLENERKLTFINENVNAALRKVFRWFAGCQDTPIYDALNNRDVEYFSCVVRKPGI